MKKKVIVILTLLFILILITVIIYQQHIIIKSNQKLNVGFIYINSISDFGWTYAHESGRIQLKNNFKQISAIYRENVSPDNLALTIKELVEKERCKVIVTTSFSYDSNIINLSNLYPDIIFLSCAGFTVKKNLIPYMVDLYQIYYLNGLIAAGSTKTGKIGYIGAYKIPEVIRHINAFTIGAKEINPNIKVNLSWLNKWYDPEKSSNIAKKMIEDGIDVIAYTEDSSAIPETCQKYYEETGKKIYTFSHYSPMDKFGEDVIVSGQIVNWGLLYINIFNKILSGRIEPKLHYWFANSNAAILGKNYNTMISQQVIEILKEKKLLINSNKINLYEYIIFRYNQMKDNLITYDPFTGPIYSNKGELKIYNRERANLTDLLTMDWFISSIFEVNY